MLASGYITDTCTIDSMRWRNAGPIAYQLQETRLRWQIDKLRLRCFFLCEATDFWTPLLCICMYV